MRDRVWTVQVNLPDKEVDDLISQYPSVGSREMLGEYNFDKFYFRGPPPNGILKGYTGLFWVIGKSNLEYAFVNVCSLESGWGYEMMKNTIDYYDADLFIWVTHPTNWRSTRLAERLGFTRKSFDEFYQIEPNPLIDTSGYVGALFVCKGSEALSELVNHVRKSG